MRGRWCAGTPWRPARRSAPGPARSGSRPIRVRSVVVLPAPLRPISATRPPGGTRRCTSRSTGTPAMSTEPPSSSSMEPWTAASAIGAASMPMTSRRTAGSASTAAGGPRVRMRPWLQTATRSAKRATTSMSCSTNTAVTPASRSTRTRVSTTPIFSDAATPEVGSSISSRRGSSATAMAMSASLRAPSFSASARASATPSSPNRASSVHRLLPVAGPEQRDQRRPDAGAGGDGERGVLQHRVLGEELRELEGAADAAADDGARREAEDRPAPRTRCAPACGRR